MPVAQVPRLALKKSVAADSEMAWANMIVCNPEHWRQLLWHAASPAQAKIRTRMWEKTVCMGKWGVEMEKIGRY